MIFTAFPILLLAGFDRPYTKDVARYCPQLYKIGGNSELFNAKTVRTYFGTGRSWYTFLSPTHRKIS